MKYTSERRDDKHFAKFERDGGNTPAQRCEVIFVVAGDLLDETMFSESSDQGGYLLGCLGRQAFLKVGIAKAGDVEFTADDGQEEVEIISMKEIEPSVSSVVGLDRAGNFLNVLDAVGGIVNGREELDVAPVGVTEDLGEFRQAVNGFLERREFVGLAPIAVYHLSVVFEKRDVVGGRLDTQHDAVFVVHFDCGLSHVVFDAGALDAGMKVVAEFVLKAFGKFASEKHGHLFGFHGVDGGTDEFFINGLKFALASKDDVGGIFDLHQAPMVSAAEMAHDGAIGVYGLVQDFVKMLRDQALGELLRAGRIIQLNEGIVPHRVANLLPVELPCQDVVAITVELKTERCPRRHPQIAQPQVRVNKVKIIVQTFTGGWFEKCLVRLFVMPRLEGVTWFHRRENMDQARMAAPLADDALDTVFLAKVLFLDELDLQPMIACNRFRMGTQLLPELVCPVGIVEYRETKPANKARHCLGVSHIDQRARDHDAVITREKEICFVCVSFGKWYHPDSIPYRHHQYAA